MFNLEDELKKVEAGDMDACVDLGCRYMTGDEVPEDMEEAVRLFRLAAEQGNMVAQKNLGTAYDYGDGVEADPEKALYWFRKSADQGYDEAQLALGCCYMNGNGVKQDEAQASEWFRLAAEQGHALAQAFLASLYSQGKGVEQDETEALKWYLKAAEQENELAQFALAGYYLYGRGGLERDVNKGLEYLYQAAENGSDDAVFNLASMYYTGDDALEQDYEEAFSLYSQLAERDDIEAQKMLAQMYREGEGTEPDPEKALEWSRKAADLEEGYTYDNLDDARYVYEHRILRDIFFADPEGTFEELAEGGASGIYEDFSERCRRRGITAAAEKSDYRMYRKTVNGKEILRIVMPKPKRSPQCFEINLVLDKEKGTAHYFTVERGNTAKDRVLCSWDENEKHYNYGSCTAGVGETMKKIAEISVGA